MRYQPKRSSKRWLEGAPEYVLACYDNRGQTYDRVSVYLGGSMWEPSFGRNVMVLYCTERGICCSAEDDRDAVYRPPSRDKVKWLDLDAGLRSQIDAWVKEP